MGDLLVAYHDGGVPARCRVPTGSGDSGSKGTQTRSQSRWPSCSMCEREQVAKIEVVSEDNESMFPRPSQDLSVFGFWITDLGPVLGFESMYSKGLPPLGGKTHVDKKFHPRATATSISSTRQVAYARAARMSSFSR